MVGNRRSSKFFSAGNFPVLCFSQKITTLWAARVLCRAQKEKPNHRSAACFVQVGERKKKKKRWVDGCSVEKTFLCITIEGSLSILHLSAVAAEKHSGDDCGQEWPGSRAQCARRIIPRGTAAHNALWMRWGGFSMPNAWKTHARQRQRGSRFLSLDERSTMPTFSSLCLRRLHRAHADVPQGFLESSAAHEASCFDFLSRGPWKFKIERPALSSSGKRELFFWCGSREMCENF